MDKSAHNQIKINIVKNEDIEVDEGIAPLIILLNSMPGVYTIYSCQGEEYTDRAEGYLNAYVWMFCADNESLELIRLAAMGTKHTIELKEYFLLNISFDAPIGIKEFYKHLKLSLEHIKEDEII